MGTALAEREINYLQSNGKKWPLIMRGDGVSHNHELLGLHCMRNLNHQNNTLNLKEPHKDF